ncbi:MAG: hypothetical protein Q9M26_04660 [Mariprofundales bacterium]|nr:hypothetical protein [Mariprofundales bacterium]
MMHRPNSPPPCIRPSLQGAGIFLLAWLTFAVMQFASPGLAGIDGYYHATIAHIVWQHGIHFAFPYLPFTTLNADHFVDMHMLFHIVQSPFTAWLPADRAVKYAEATFCATLFTLFFFILRLHRIRFPVLWTIFLFAATPIFLYRLNLPRPPVFAVFYILLAFHFLIHRHKTGIFLVAMAFAWTYKAFPILIPMALFAIIVFWHTERKIAHELLWLTLGGMAAGLIITPWFPDNVIFLWDAIRMKILTSNFHTHVGNEWYPYDTWYLLQRAYLPLAAVAIGLWITDRHEWKSDPPRLFWMMMSLFWMVMLFKSRRFAEFFVPSAVMFLAFALRPHLDQLTLRWQRSNWRPLAAITAVSIMLVYTATQTFSDEVKQMAGRAPITAYAGGANWLKNHTPKGSLVFHTDWDDFPRLFFFNQHNRYIVGLDPDYMRLHDAKLYQQWRNISRGENQHPAKSILKQFGARFVFTDNRHKKFRKYADRSDLMRTVFHDTYTTVYEIINSP